jgi:protein-tyrosine-phosphatase
MMSRVLFICTGNVCRSPMAAALFNSRAGRSGDAPAYIGESAGTRALENQPAAAHAMTAMAERGIDLSAHRGRTVTREMIDNADAIIVMTRSHLDALAFEFPRARHKIHLMSKLIGRTFDIADPYGSALNDYKDCADSLEQLIDTGYEQVKSWISNFNS